VIQGGLGNGCPAKAHEVYITGSLSGAALLGLAAGSWAAFLATLIVLVGVGRAGGEIRPSRRVQ